MAVFELDLDFRTNYPHVIPHTGFDPMDDDQVRAACNLLVEADSKQNNGDGDPGSGQAVDNLNHECIGGLLYVQGDPDKPNRYKVLNFTSPTAPASCASCPVYLRQTGGELPAQSLPPPVSLTVLEYLKSEL